MKSRGEKTSIYLPTRTKDMLDKMCEEFQESKSRFISSLIEEKYYKADLTKKNENN